MAERRILILEGERECLRFFIFYYRNWHVNILYCIVLYCIGKLGRESCELQFLLRVWLYWCYGVEVCGNGCQPSHSHKFQSHSISHSHHPMPAKHLFPFSLVFHIDIPISIPDYLTLTTMWYVEQLVEVALSFIRHSIIALATQIHETTFNTHTHTQMIY